MIHVESMYSKHITYFFAIYQSTLICVVVGIT